MKTTGFVKKIDELGRIVIPKDIRKALGVNNLEYVEFYFDEDKVVIKKSGNCCSFCGSADKLAPFKDKYICENCLSELVKESGELKKIESSLKNI